MSSSQYIRDILFGILWVGFGLWVWFYVEFFPELPEGYPGPALFPRIIAVGLIASGAVLGTRGLWQRKLHRTGPKPGRRVVQSGLVRLVLGLVLVVVFPWIYGWIGFVPALGLLILGMGLLLGISVRMALSVALVSSGLIYVLFTQLLGVPL